MGKVSSKDRHARARRHASDMFMREYRIGTIADIVNLSRPALRSISERLRATPDGKDRVLSTGGSPPQAKTILKSRTNAREVSLLLATVRRLYGGQFAGNDYGFVVMYDRAYDLYVTVRSCLGLPRGAKPLGRDDGFRVVRAANDLNQMREHACRSCGHRYYTPTLSEGVMVCPFC